MKKLLSLTVAAALSVSSVGMFASAAPNRFGVEPESSIDVGLDLKIGTGSAYADYSSSTSPLTFTVSDSSAVNNFNAKATIDMSRAKAKWDEYINAGAAYLVDRGTPEGEARNVVLAGADLSDSVFTLTVTAPSKVTNPAGAGVTLDWSDAAETLFVQDGDTVYTESGNTTTYTVTMKINATNAELDEYFSDETLEEISVAVADNQVTGIDTYKIEARFNGTIAINVPSDDDMTINLTGTDASYVRQKKSGGGGGSTAISTPKPTETPSTEPSTEPTETPSTEPTETPSVEPQKGGTANGAKLNYDQGFAYINGYDTEDGRSVVRPENPITRAEVATIFYRLLTEESREKFMSQVNEFTDVAATAWYNTEISTAAAAGIINGYDDDTFRPDQKITRAEFAAIASRFTTIKHEGDSLFSDIDDHWAKDAINDAAATGWITGYSDGSFKPDEYITRAEAITLINRVLYRIIGEDSGDDSINWEDNTPDKWYYEDVQNATNDRVSTTVE